MGYIKDRNNILACSGGKFSRCIKRSIWKWRIVTLAKQGVITLIEKEGKDSIYIPIYRPITLLNADYKILSKVLSNRLKRGLSRINHSDQVGYIKDRNIGEAVRVIFFHSLKQTVFGRSWFGKKLTIRLIMTFIWSSIELFGFGDYSWERVICKDICSCVMTGGHSTWYFQIKRGVRQGDSLSLLILISNWIIVSSCNYKWGRKKWAGSYILIIVVIWYLLFSWSIDLLFIVLHC